MTGSVAYLKDNILMQMRHFFFFFFFFLNTCIELEKGAG